MRYRATLVALVAAFVTSSLAYSQIGASRVNPQITSPVTSNATASPDVFRVQYFRNANTNGHSPETVRVVDPGTNGTANLCVDIYVVTPDEELTECCGCVITPDQLLEFNIDGHLAANSANGVVAHNGTIKIISSALGAAGSGPTRNGCDPGNPTPTPALRAWVTRSLMGFSDPEATGEEFSSADLNKDEQAFLTGTCAFFERSLSGKGICACPLQLGN